MSHGFVYCLINPSMPGLVKIGFTHKHPLARMAELSKATACPIPFEMLAFFDTAVPREVERAIHQELDEYRSNPCREFFSVSYMVLQDVVRQWCDPIEGICNLLLLDEMADEESREEAEALCFAVQEVRNGTRS